MSAVDTGAGGRLLVTVRTWRKTEATRFDDYASARDAVIKARSQGYDARLKTEGEQPTNEEPEHRGDRRRFIVWAVLGGFAGSDTLTERIVSEIKQELSY
jgi:hypothetical protein